MKMDEIEMHSDVCNGRPVVRGTRIAAESVLGMLAAGDSVDEVLRAFPTLTRVQVLACIDHAARLMHNQYTLDPVFDVVADPWLAAALTSVDQVSC